MSFSLWATAFTDDISTISATFLNKVRTELSRAVDGVNGGSYTLGSFLEFIGSGVKINPLLQAVITGPVTLQGDAATTAWRIDSSTIADANATIDVSKDEYLIEATPTAQRTVTLRSSTAPIPVRGQRIRVRRKDKLGAFKYVFRRESALVLAEFPVSEQSWIEFVYDGTNWRNSQWHSNLDTSINDT